MKSFILIILIFISILSLKFILESSEPHKVCTEVKTVYVKHIGLAGSYPHDKCVKWVNKDE